MAFDLQSPTRLQIFQLIIPPLRWYYQLYAVKKSKIKNIKIHSLKSTIFHCFSPRLLFIWWLIEKVNYLCWETSGRGRTNNANRNWLRWKPELNYWVQLAVLVLEVFGFSLNQHQNAAKRMEIQYGFFVHSRAKQTNYWLLFRIVCFGGDIYGWKVHLETKLNIFFKRTLQ